MGTEAQMTAGCPKGLFFMDRREPHCKGCTPSERRPGRQHIAELQQGCACAPAPPPPSAHPQGLQTLVTAGCLSLPLLRDNCHETASS